MAYSQKNRKKPLGAKCEAKKKGGGLCQNRAMPNGRCKLHGGMSTGPRNKSHLTKNPNAFKHGLYSDTGLLREELSIFPHVKVGNLEDEIKMMKIKLRRLWKLQKEWEEDQEKADKEIEKGKRGDKVGKFTRKYFPVDSVENNETRYLNTKTGKFESAPTRKITRKKNDYMDQIKSLTKLISIVEEKHKNLVSDGLGSEELLNKLVDSFRGFAEEAIDTLPGKQM